MTEQVYPLLPTATLKRVLEYIDVYTETIRILEEYRDSLEAEYDPDLESKLGDLQMYKDILNSLEYHRENSFNEQ